MKENKNIDRLFQEKFKNFEATPDDAIWEKVNSTLHGVGPAKKPLPAWWKWAGIAAAIVILLSAGSYFMGTSDRIVEDSQIVDVDNPSNKSNQNKPVNNNDQSPVLVDENTSKENSNNRINNGNNPPSKVAATPNAAKKGINNKNEVEENIKSSNKPALNNVTSTVANSDKKGDPSANKLNQRSDSNSKDSEDSPYLDSENEASSVAAAKNSNKPFVTGIKADDSTAAAIAANPAEKNIGLQKKNDSTTIEQSKVVENPTVVVDNSTTTNKTDKDIPNASSVIKENINPTDVSTIAENNEENESPIEVEVAILEDINEKEKEEVEKINRWNISPNVSPVYFNSFGNGSSIDGQFTENSKSGKINFSYGINGSYALNDRFKVRAGVNKVDLGYRTNQVIVYRNVNTRVNGNERLRYVKFKDNQINTSFISASNLSFSVVPDVVANSLKSFIDQELGFIEIPLEVEYALLKQRFGINVIGGFSTFFLNKNEIYSSLLGDRTLLGEANNINNTSYSANLGVGLNFKFSESIDLNLEPTFKYQFETFSESAGNFQPYFIGIYSGIRFKF